MVEMGQDRGLRIEVVVFVICCHGHVNFSRLFPSWRLQSSMHTLLCIFSWNIRTMSPGSRFLNVYRVRHDSPLLLLLDSLVYRHINVRQKAASKQGGSLLWVERQ